MMRALYTLVALAIATSGGAHAAERDDIAALIETDKRQQRAYVDRDWDVLERIFSDDYVIVYASGIQRDKREVLKRVTAPDIRWEINETSDWQVRVQGDTGIVVANLHMKGVDRGQPFDVVLKFSDTYVRENDRWVNIHAHASQPSPVGGEAKDAVKD